MTAVNAIMKLLSKLEPCVIRNGGKSLRNSVALEFYARSGTWMTTDYSDGIQELHAWEIDKQFEADLRLNLPNANVRIGDSYVISLEDRYNTYFDVVVLDNPQGVWDKYCEHFEALERAFVLVKSPSIIVFNVNFRPFDYDSHPDWQRVRSEYYGKDARHLSENDITETYISKCESAGFKVLSHASEIRDSKYLMLFGIVVKRV